MIIDNINNIVHSTADRVHFRVFIRTEFISYVSIHNNNNNKNVNFYVRGGLPSKKKKKEKLILVIRSLLYFLLSLWAVSEPTWKSEGTLLFMCIGY